MENNHRTVPKSTCYFCHENIQNQMGHMEMCGSVLVSCPRNCGNYVKRMDLKKHNKECLNRVVKASPKSSTTTTPYATIQRQFIPANLVQNEIKRVDTENEIYKLSRKLADLDSRLASSQTQQSASHQNLGALKTSQLQLNLEIEKLKYQNQITSDWRLKVDALLSQLKQGIITIENSKKDNDNNLKAVQSRIFVMEKWQEQLTQLKDSFLREQAYNRQVDMNFNEHISDLSKQFVQENTKNLAILSDLKDSVSSIKTDLEEATSTIQDQGIKFTHLIYDIQNASRIATDASQLLGNLEQDVETIKRNVNQIKLDMEILEELTSSGDTRFSPGRLLWKIVEVNSKLKDAKQHDTVLKSPIFYTHDYGYKVRVLLYLNGLKKWKDRYALLSLHVLKGEYDLLLKWPCCIEGSVTLRDLEDLDNAKPFTKTITAKRQTGDEECEDPQESSSCYIFIPHNTLLKYNHVKNDTMFLDIKIRQNGKLETSL